MNTFVPLDIGELAERVPLADSKIFDIDVYRDVGFFVVRDLIPSHRITRWQDDWAQFQEARLSAGRTVNKYNPVHLNEAVPESLAAIHECPELLDLMQQVYPDLALFMQRFVVKDSQSRTPVFPHNDFCYDYGWPEKTTTFVPLSPSNSENGGISFYPCTHHFGYLGDAGECNLALLAEDWPLICPELEPGDVALCHTCTWHGSPAHVGGPDRVLVQSTFQPSNDPSSTKLLRGNWKGRYYLNQIPRGEFFTRSRSSRLRELQAQVDAL